MTSFYIVSYKNSDNRCIILNVYEEVTSYISFKEMKVRVHTIEECIYTNRQNTRHEDKLLISYPSAMTESTE